MAFLCIDIGGTNTLFGIGNGDFEKVAEVKTKKFLNDISNCVKSILEDSRHSSIDEISVAAAGPVDKEKGLFYPPNIDKEFVQIREPLEEFAPVEIINDCAAAVLGEYHYGESAEDLLYITISSGIGAAYVSKGRLIEGKNGNFGEIGHMRIGDKLECGCGGIGHWEAYCSGNNISEMARELYGVELDHPRDLFMRNDEEAKNALEKFKEKTCIGLANLVNLYNPEKIVFGGAVALNHFDNIMSSIKDDVERQTVNEMPEMTLCSLGETVVLHGLRASCNKEIEK